VQCLAAPSLEATRPQQAVDDDRLVILGDRRKADDLPVLLRQHVADQIVLVQPVHDQHDRSLLLVIQAAVERMVKPFVGALPVRFRQGLLGFQWIIDDDDVGTRPVSTPPTEVAIMIASGVPGDPGHDQLRIGLATSALFR